MTKAHPGGILWLKMAMRQSIKEIISRKSQMNKENQRASRTQEIQILNVIQMSVVRVLKSFGCLIFFCLDSFSLIRVDDYILMIIPLAMLTFIPFCVSFHNQL